MVSRVVALFASNRISLWSDVAMRSPCCARQTRRPSTTSAVRVFARSSPHRRASASVGGITLTPRRTRASTTCVRGLRHTWAMIGDTVMTSRSLRCASASICTARRSSRSRAMNAPASRMSRVTQPDRRRRSSPMYVIAVDRFAGRLDRARLGWRGWLGWRDRMRR